MKNFIRFLIYSLLLIMLVENLLATHPSVRRVNEWFSATNVVIQIDRPWVFDNGILFTYNGKMKGYENLNRKLKVYLSGSFLDWERKIPMVKNYYGIYQVFLPLPLEPGEYTYRFWVNGLWINDQEQPHLKYDRSGEQVSYFKIDELISVSIDKSPKRLEGLKNQFRFYLKDKGYTKVYWLSTKNGWNPSTHPMKLVHGFWTIDQSIFKKELYLFWVDEEKTFDSLNPQIYETPYGFKANLIDPVQDYDRVR